MARNMVSAHPFRWKCELMLCFLHARRTVGMRMALPTTERLVWHCGEHTAKPESAS